MFVRVADYLADAGQGGDFFWRTLRIAAGDYDLSLWVLTMDAADSGAGVLVGRGRYGAGVEDYQPCFRCFPGAFQSVFPQLALDGSAVRLGSTASEIRHVESRHISILT